MPIISPTITAKTSTNQKGSFTFSVLSPSSMYILFTIQA